MNRFRRRWQGLLELGRVSNLPTIWSNITVAAFLSGGASGSIAVWSLLLAGGTLLYVGGTTLNDFFDAAFDRRHRRERPIPLGVWGRGAVGAIGFVELIAGALLMIWAGSDVIWLSGLLVSILVYDGVHKHWAGSVIFMGACRAFLALAVMSAFAATFGVVAWLYVASLMLYIIGITLTARAESGDESLRRWPRWLLFTPLAGSLAALVLPLPAPMGGVLPWILALTAFGLMLARALQRLVDRRDPGRIGACVSQLLAGIVLLDGLFLGVVAGWLWLGLLLLFAASLAWQGRVAAT